MARYSWIMCEMRSPLAAKTFICERCKGRVEVAESITYGEVRKLSDAFIQEHKNCKKVN